MSRWLLKQLFCLVLGDWICCICKVHCVMQASLQKFYFFYSHSRFRLTWQGTRKPLGGLVVISVIASSTVKAVAVLRAAEQASPRHSSPLGVVRLPSSRWSLLPLLAFAPLCAKKPHSLLINAQEPLCG